MIKDSRILKFSLCVLLEKKIPRVYSFWNASPSLKFVNFFLLDTIFIFTYLIVPSY